MNDPLGAPITNQIMQSTFEPILDAFLDKLRTDGFEIEITQSNSGYLIIFGKPGEPQNTVAGENAMEALQELIRNMTQLGLLPKELLEMQRQIEQQIRPVRDAVTEQLETELKNAIVQPKD